MRKLYVLAVALFVVFVVLASVSIVIGNRRPAALDESLIVVGGNENVLHMGDYFVLWGKPTGMACSGGWQMQPCDTIDVWWNETEIDIDSHNFGPYSTVQFTSRSDQQSAGTRWRGFIQYP